MTRSYEALRGAIDTYRSNLFDKSREVARFFESRMALVGLGWLVLTLPIAAFKLATPVKPFTDPVDLAWAVAAYAVAIAAPIAGYMVARGAFDRPATIAQPSYRFAVFGRWQPVDPANARLLPEYGPVGFVASLMIGMVLNVVIRTGEFMLAVPVMGSASPQWGTAMFALMTLDVVVTGFFYMAAFAMALKTIPLFPRMLVFAWAVDLAMQILIAKQLAAIGGIPPMVVEPLVTLLNGNIDKVLISVAIWMPYLLLSQRVNVTYRHRSAA